MIRKNKYRSSFFAEIELLNILSREDVLLFDEICKRSLYSRSHLTKALRNLLKRKLVLLAVYRGGKTKDFIIADSAEEIKTLEAMLQDTSLMKAYYSEYLKKLQILSKTNPVEVKRKIKSLPLTYEEFIKFQKRKYEELKKYGLYKNQKIFAASITSKGKMFLKFMDQKIREIIKNYYEPLTFIKEIMKFKEEAYEQFDRLPQYAYPMEGRGGSKLSNTCRGGKASSQQNDKRKDG